MNSSMSLSQFENDINGDPIAAAFLRAASQKPGKPFLQLGKKILSYGDLVDRTGRLASLFTEKGLSAGDRILIATLDDEEAIVFFLTALRCGVTAILIDPLMPAASARNLISVSSAKAFILDETLHQSWQPLPSSFVLKISKSSVSNLFEKLLRKKRITDVSDSYPAILDKMESNCPVEAHDKNIDAYIMFTSGTTSKPKGVQISRFNLARHLDTLSRQFRYDNRSRILNVLPLHHADGIIQGPIAAFWNSASVSRPMRFQIPSIPRLLDTIYSERITHFVAVPTILSLLLQFGGPYEDSFDTEDFNFIISAAAKLEQNLWEQFEQRFKTKIVNIYGLTETVTGGLFSGPDDSSRKIGTVGKPVDCEARIMNENGLEATHNEIGELIMRGENVMKGYLDDPDTTTKVLKDGWFYTGDLGTKDNEGFFRITGRKKNIIISGGINIHPEEVTEVLNSHPDVIESVTFGKEDEIWGEVVVSCVVTNTGTNELSLIDFCRSRLSPEKLPTKIRILPDLPKGPSGKIILDEVRRLFDDESPDRAGAYSEVFDRDLIKIAAQVFKLDTGLLSPESSQANTPGWDSLAHLQFILAIEKFFNIRLEPFDIIRIDTLNAAISVVNEKKRFS